jgi:hypothetical protein
LKGFDMAVPETYLGDGVYASWDGYQVWLDVRWQGYLSVGPTGNPGIALEPQLLHNAAIFVKQCVTPAPVENEP